MDLVVQPGGAGVSAAMQRDMAEKAQKLFESRLVLQNFLVAHAPVALTEPWRIESAAIEAKGYYQIIAQSTEPDSTGHYMRIRWHTPLAVKTASINPVFVIDRAKSKTLADDIAEVRLQFTKQEFNYIQGLQGDKSLSQRLLSALGDWDVTSPENRSTRKIAWVPRKQIEELRNIYDHATTPDRERAICYAVFKAMHFDFNCFDQRFESTFRQLTAEPVLSDGIKPTDQPSWGEFLRSLAERFGHIELAKVFLVFSKAAQSLPTMLPSGLVEPIINAAIDSPDTRSHGIAMAVDPLKFVEAMLKSSISNKLALITNCLDELHRVSPALFAEAAFNILNGEADSTIKKAALQRLAASDLSVSVLNALYAKAEGVLNNASEDVRRALRDKTKSLPKKTDRYVTFAPVESRLSSRRRWLWGGLGALGAAGLGLLMLPRGPRPTKAEICAKITRLRELLRSEYIKNVFGVAGLPSVEIQPTRPLPAFMELESRVVADGDGRFPTKHMRLRDSGSRAIGLEYEAILGELKIELPPGDRSVDLSFLKIHRGVYEAAGEQPLMLSANVHIPKFRAEIYPKSPQVNGAAIERHVFADPTVSFKIRASNRLQVLIEGEFQFKDEKLIVVQQERSDAPGVGEVYYNHTHSSIIKEGLECIRELFDSYLLAEIEFLKNGTGSGENLLLLSEASEVASPGVPRYQCFQTEAANGLVKALPTAPHRLSELKSFSLRFLMQFPSAAHEIAVLFESSNDQLHHIAVNSDTETLASEIRDYLDDTGMVVPDGLRMLAKGEFGSFRRSINEDDDEDRKRRAVTATFIGLVGKVRKLEWDLLKLTKFLK